MSQKRVKALIVEFFGTLFLSLFIIGTAMSLNQDRTNLSLFLVAAVSSILLAVLIVILLPLSGALLNPLLVMWAIFRKDLTINLGLIVIFLQSVGAILGAYLANYFFATQISLEVEKVTYELPEYLISFLLSFGLIFIVASIRKLDFNGNSAFLIPAWLFATILLSGGTTFSNPSIEIARVFADGFLKFSASNAGLMILAEILGAITAAIVAVYIYGYKLKRIKFR
jgi:glycerol uptake facilitator-like aquaporin